VNCSKCGKPFPVYPAGHVGGTGYAVKNDGSKICYPCADAEQLEALKARKPTGAYLSGDGKNITTWTGGILASVTVSKPCRITGNGVFNNPKSYRSIRAKDLHGNLWAGRGSPGVHISLRPVKP